MVTMIHTAKINNSAQAVAHLEKIVKHFQDRGKMINVVAEPGHFGKIKLTVKIVDSSVIKVHALANTFQTMITGW